jgi:hypothetical protein
MNIQRLLMANLVMLAFSALAQADINWTSRRSIQHLFPREH